MKRRTLEMNGIISCNRGSGTVEEEFMEIVITDCLSHCAVIKVKISMEHFAHMITGRDKACGFEWTAHPERIGKKMEVDTLEFVMPKCPFEDRIKNAYEEAKKRCSEGWEPDYYFGSQNSFTLVNDVPEMLMVRCTVRRWI